MRRSFVTLILAAGCASAATPSQQPATVLAPDTRGNLRLSQAEGSGSISSHIDAPPETVFGIVKQVYLKLGVPTTIENTSPRRIGNNNFWKTRRFADAPMSDLMDCGSGMTGPKANEYRIYMSLITRVTPDSANGSKVETTFTPIAQDVAGGSTDRIPCGSTGKLEQIIHASVAAKLGK